MAEHESQASAGAFRAGIVELDPQPTVGLRRRLPLAGIDLGAFFAETIPRVTAGLSRLGAEPVGGPYARYLEWGPEQADIEVGMPVAAPVDGLAASADSEPGELGNSELPGGRFASTTHVGPYDGLAAATMRLHEWIENEGLEPLPGQWELYVDDPQAVSASELRTELYWPVS